MPDSPIPIDSRFVNVDFPNEAKFTFGDLGKGLFADAPPIYEDAVELIPEAEWPAEIEKLDSAGGSLENLCIEIFNQGSEGSCVSNATAQAHQIVQAQQWGKPNVVQLSAINLYKRVGRSAGSGSMLSDNLDEIRTRGILPQNTPENIARFPHTMPATGFGSSMPSGWEATAGLFTALEQFDIRSFAGLVSASLRGAPVVVGRSGHSICYVRPIIKSGAVAFLYANSWGSWGQAAGGFAAGFGVDTGSLVRNSAAWAFALRSVNGQPKVI